MHDETKSPLKKKCSHKGFWTPTKPKEFHFRTAERKGPKESKNKKEKMNGPMMSDNKKKRRSLTEPVEFHFHLLSKEKQKTA